MARERHLEVRPFPPTRRLVLGAMRAGRHLAPIHGLICVDVTEARRRCADPAARLSFTAFIVACAARAAARHPEVHAYRDWRGRLVLHRYVDVATLIEVAGPDGPFPLAHLVRDADVREVADISAELRRVKADPVTSRDGRMLRRFGPLARVPGASAAFYWALARSVRMRRIAGTVSVTSVGMFAGGGGFGIGVPTVLSLGIFVGGAGPRPWVIADRIEIRDVLDLTITVDHNVVDGAPATRFAADLRRMLESAEGLDPACIDRHEPELRRRP
jgi:pyruvate/2-oxoglutarate dehydrogenase complex dihydrolipoamide acyltransferase (E2) component